MVAAQHGAIMAAASGVTRIFGRRMGCPGPMWGIMGERCGWGMAIKALLRLKHDRRDLGFYHAQVDGEDCATASWCLRVECPADTEEYRAHLTSGSAMDLTMITREGEYLTGEACVASVSDCSDAATVVLLSGVGPLLRQ